MSGILLGMAKTRRGQQQPMRRGTGRQPGEALSAALRGNAAPGVASAMGAVEQKRALAKNAGKLADTLAGAVGAAGGGLVIPKGGARKIPGPVSPALTGAKTGGSVAMPNAASKRSLADATAKPVPANRSSSRAGSTAKPQVRTYTDGPKVNTTKNERAGEEFQTFQKPGKNGDYHDYGVDPKTGKRKVVFVKKKRGAGTSAP